MPTEAPPRRSLHRILRELFWEEGYRVAAALMGIVAVQWGIAVLWPGNVLSVSDAGKALLTQYPYLELFLGAMGVVAGLFQITALVTERHRALSWATTLSVFGWVLVAVVYWLAEAGTTAPASFITRALISLFLCVRVWMDDGE